MWSSVTNLSPVWTPWTSWLFSCDIVGSSGDEQQPGGLKFMILLLHEKKNSTSTKIVCSCAFIVGISNSILI